MIAAPPCRECGSTNTEWEDPCCDEAGHNEFFRCLECSEALQAAPGAADLVQASLVAAKRLKGFKPYEYRRRR